jgi:hypothetical protein
VGGKLMSMNYDIMQTIANFCVDQDLDPEDGATLYNELVVDLEWDWDDDTRREDFLRVWEKINLDNLKENS